MQRATSGTFWNSDQPKAIKAFDDSLARLGLDYLDLYLVHFPVTKSRAQAWKDMEHILASGKTRSVGVSNYMPRHLDELLSASSLKPVVNQIELHPERPQAALRARQPERLSAIRLLLAAIKQREVDERKVLTDVEIATVIERLVKQRRESIRQFRDGGREDLAQREEFELSVLAAYSPQPLSDDEVGAAIDAALAEAGARGAQDMGRVMALLKARLAGRADLARVSALVRARLG